MSRQKSLAVVALALLAGVAAFVTYFQAGEYKAPTVTAASPPQIASSLAIAASANALGGAGAVPTFASGSSHPAAPTDPRVSERRLQSQNFASAMAKSQDIRASAFAALRSPSDGGKYVFSQAALECAGVRETSKAFSQAQLNASQRIAVDRAMLQCGSYTDDELKLAEVYRQMAAIRTEDPIFQLSRALANSPPRATLWQSVDAAIRSGQSRIIATLISELSRCEDGSIYSCFEGQKFSTKRETAIFYAASELAACSFVEDCKSVTPVISLSCLAYASCHTQSFDDLILQTLASDVDKSLTRGLAVQIARALRSSQESSFGR